jgi:hypothetical protein
VWWLTPVFPATPEEVEIAVQGKRLTTLPHISTNKLCVVVCACSLSYVVDINRRITVQTNKNKTKLLKDFVLHILVVAQSV